MGREEMRAGDSDRQAVADKLKQALDEGRLDLAEYDERLQQAYGAKTYGDLKGLLDDLPTANLPAPAKSTEPARQAQLPQRINSERAGQLVKAWLGGFGGIFVVGTVIWLISSVGSGHMQYFWPMWLLIPMVLGGLGRIGEGDKRKGKGKGKRKG